MDVIYRFFGTVLGVFYGSSESLALSSILICMIIKVLFITMTKNYYNLPKISEDLKPQIEEIERKYKNSDEKRRKAISDLLVSKQYPFASFAVYYALMMAIAVFIALTTHYPEEYIEVFNPEASRSFMMVPDVTQFTFPALKSSYPDISMLRYLILPIAACVLQYLQEAYMTSKSLVSKKWFDVISLPITFGAAISLPQTFSIFWIVYKLTNFIHILTNEKLLNKNGLTSNIKKK